MSESYQKKGPDPDRRDVIVLIASPFCAFFLSFLSCVSSSFCVLLIQQDHTRLGCGLLSQHQHVYRVLKSMLTLCAMSLKLSNEYRLGVNNVLCIVADLESFLLPLLQAELRRLVVVAVVNPQRAAEKLWGREDTQEMKREIHRDRQ